MYGKQKRRDRINERMKALQELIPRCNKVSFFSFSLQGVITIPLVADTKLYIFVILSVR